MSWQIDLADHPLHAVQIVDGHPRQVAAWLTRTAVRFYSVDNGAFYDTLTIDAPERATLDDDVWRSFVESVRAPRGDFLVPFAARDMTVLTSYDGRLRVYWDHQGPLLLDSDGQRGPLLCRDDTPFIAVGLDRDLGTVAALSAANNLHFFQQHVYVGHYALEDAQPDGGLRRVFIPDAVGVALVVYENGAQIVDLSGRVRFRLAVPSAVGAAACSPGGNLLILGERDQSVVLVYDAELRLLHRGNLRDVLEQAQPLQLMPRTPGPEAALRGLAVDDDGVFAFALDGVMCCAHVEMLPDVPYPRPLF